MSSVAPGGIAGRDFWLLLAATVGAFANFAPLLSVVPLWAGEGGAHSAGAGSTTGVMMGATVAVQLCMGLLMRLLSLRTIFVIGSLLLGPASAAYLLSSDLPWLLTVSAVRGAGFGMVVVSGSALVAELVPLAQRGRAVGRYGVAVGLPSVVLLPIAVWLVDRVGYTPLFLTGAVLALLAAPLIGAMSGTHVDDSPAAAPEFPTDARRWRPLLAPWSLLLTVACAMGGIITFVPLTLTSSTTASSVLFVVSAAMIAGRAAAGVLRDRTGSGTVLLVGGVLTCAIGMAGIGLALDLTTAAATAALAITSGIVYGAGFGMIQNETLVVMFERAGPGGHGRASTIWNLAFDAGTGAGAWLIGLAAIELGMHGAFLAAALVIALVLPATRR